jgi:hypothetical protein
MTDAVTVRISPAFGAMRVVVPRRELEKDGILMKILGRQIASSSSMRVGSSNRSRSPSQEGLSIPSAETRTIYDVLTATK